MVSSARNMKLNRSDNKPRELPLFFVHSLFRAGSTYFHSTVKKTGKYYPYHEPFHEIMKNLTNSWSDVTGRTDQIRGALRHNFLAGGYFDEYSRLLPYLKKSFDERFSYEYFFLDHRTVAQDLSAYIETLIKGAPRPPVLQCTRTIGRVQWLKLNFKSKHVFLIRNPWDQWYSYKVDEYIASTPRIILSQPDLPKVLADVLSFRNVPPSRGSTIEEKLAFTYTHPLPPETDYALFFALWVYAFVMGKRHCDVTLDMDLICEDTTHRTTAIQELAAIGLEGIDFSDANLPAAVFEPKERSFYEIIEDQVLEVFRNHSFGTDEISEVEAYLDRRRKETFSGIIAAKSSGLILNDAARLRDVLLRGERHRASITIGLTEALNVREAEITAAKLYGSQKQEEIQSLNSQLEVALGNYQNKIAELAAAHEQFDSEKSHLQSDYRNLVEEYDKTKAAYESKVRDLSALRDETDARQKSLTADHHALSEELATAKDQLSHYADRLA